MNLQNLKVFAVVTSAGTATALSPAFSQDAQVATSKQVYQSNITRVTEVVENAGPPLKAIGDESYAKLLAARISAIPDDNGRCGIVILFHGDDQETLRLIREGASSARDARGDQISVRGIIATPSKRNIFVLYIGGLLVAREYQSNRAFLGAQISVETIHQMMIEDKTLGDCAR